MTASTALTIYDGASVTNNTSSDDIERKRKLFRAFENNKTREQDEMRVSRRYYSGRQITDAEIAKLERRKQPVIWDNRISRKIDFLVGVEQRMRRDPKAVGRTPKDQKPADVVTASVRFVCDQSRWESMASAAAHDGLVSGIGVVWVGAGRAADRSGNDPVLKDVQVDRFFYDPRSEKADFSDARYMGMHLWLDAEDVKAEYPQHAEEIGKMMDRNGGLTKLRLEEDRGQQWADFETSRIRVVEMYERKPLPNGEGYGWYYCKFTGGFVFESMWSPYLDEHGMPDCPYIAWSPYIDERGDRYGMVRNMRPMQDEINKRRSRLLHLTNSQKLFTSAGTVDDIDKLREENAKPDGILELPAGTQWGKDVGPIDHSFEFKGHADLLAQAQASLENLGPNPGLIGKGGGVADQSGRAILAQRDSGMTELSPVFERLRDWKLRVYRKVWARVRQLWTSERYIRITDNPKAPAFLGINQYGIDPMTGMATAQNVLSEIDVDIILDEGPDTIVMQEELLQTLSQLGEAAMGPMGRVMIELSQVSNKDILLDIMDKATAPAPEVMALKQRMDALEVELKAATVAKAHAEIEAKRVDSAVKLAGTMMPPQAVAQSFPIPFADTQPPPQAGGQQMPQQMPPDTPEDLPPMPDMQGMQQEMPGQMPGGAEAQPF